MKTKEEILERYFGSDFDVLSVEDVFNIFLSMDEYALEFLESFRNFQREFRSKEDPNGFGQTDDYIYREFIKKPNSGIPVAETPRLIGHLNQRWGLKGFETAEVGHPVYESKDRYIIRLKHPGGEEVIPFYKESLSANIDFMESATPLQPAQ